MANVKIECKQAIAAIIKTVVPKAIVYPWWVVGKGIGVSIPELQTIQDDTFVDEGQKFVHGYCVGISTSERNPVAMNKKFEDTFTLKVWGFHQFVTGVKTKNSEDVFIEYLDLIQDALSKSPGLVYDNEYEKLEGVKGHNQLQFSDEIETYGFDSEKKIWIAKGTLEIAITKQV